MRELQVVDASELAAAYAAAHYAVVLDGDTVPLRVGHPASGDLGDPLAVQLLGIVVYPFLNEQPVGRAVFSTFALVVLVIAGLAEAGIGALADGGGSERDITVATSDALYSIAVESLLLLLHSNRRQTRTLTTQAFGKVANQAVSDFMNAYWYLCIFGVAGAVSVWSVGTTLERNYSDKSGKTGNSLERDKEGGFPADFHQAMARDGWLGVAMPERYGGAGLGITEAAIMMEAVAESGAGMSGAKLRPAREGRQRREPARGAARPGEAAGPPTGGAEATGGSGGSGAPGNAGKGDDESDEPGKPKKPGRR